MTFLPCNTSFTDQRQPDIGHAFLFIFSQDIIWVHKLQTKQKIGQYPAILTFHFTKNIQINVYYVIRTLIFTNPQQGCALEEPSGKAQWPLMTNFCPRRLEKLRFFIQIICCAPQNLQFQSTGLPSIFLRAQPCSETQHMSHTLIDVTIPIVNKNTQTSKLIPKAKSVD